MSVLYLEPRVCEDLIRTVIKYHKFRNNNEIPTKIVMPHITEVDGIPVAQSKKQMVVSESIDMAVNSQLELMPIKLEV